MGLQERPIVFHSEEMVVPWTRPFWRIAGVGE